MYSLAGYGSMIADRVRMDAFARALRHAIAPESVVVDIGTGTGIMALLACRFGARRVYAIETDDAIQVAREIAAANGCADRIEFIQAESTKVTLPERANVVVSDIGGLLPLFGRHIPSIVDARRRFLEPGGVLIPQLDTIWAAVVEAPALFDEYIAPWDDRFGFDMSAARGRVMNTWRKSKFTEDQLLARPQGWAVLDYAVVEDTDVRASVTWTITRPGTGHGVVAGFDRVVGKGARLNNAPDAPDAIRPERMYPTAFFPWPDPVPLEAGDTVTLDLQARLVGKDYVWGWSTEVMSSGQPRASFKQSTFFGVPRSAAQVRKQAAGYVPSLNEDGRIARLVLESMNDTASLEEVAHRVSAQFPESFPTWREALTYVADLSAKYS